MCDGGPKKETKTTILAAFTGLGSITMAASDPAGDDSLYPIAVLIDELKTEDVQVCTKLFFLWYWSRLLETSPQPFLFQYPGLRKLQIWHHILSKKLIFTEKDLYLVILQIFNNLGWLYAEYRRDSNMHVYFIIYLSHILSHL